MSSTHRNNLTVGLLFLMFTGVICIQDRAQASGVKAEESWQARRELADPAAGRRKDIIYQEEKVQDYTLPEPWDPHSGRCSLPVYTNIVEDGQPVTRVKLTLNLVHSLFIVANRQ